MEVQLKEPDLEEAVSELGEGDYFWYNEELYIRPVVEITNTHFPGIDDVIIIFCITDESLTMISPEIKVIPETRDLIITVQKEKKIT